MKKHAILIGVNEYQFLGKLDFARQDAEAVAQALKENYGFADDEITLMTCGGDLAPLDRDAVTDILTPECVGQDLDLFLFGFWGHGLLEDGTRYLCPMAQRGKNVAKYGISMDEIKTRLVNLRAKNVCLFLDCCQSKAPGRDIVLSTFRANDTRTLVEELGRVSTVAILNACSEGQRAYEWAQRRHGIFTAHLLDALGQPVRKTSELFQSIRDKVSQTASQKQYVQTPFYDCRGGSDIDLPVVERPTTPGVRVISTAGGQVTIPYDDRAAAAERAKVRMASTVKLPPIPDAILSVLEENRGIDTLLQRLTGGKRAELLSTLESVCAGNPDGTEFDVQEYCPPDLDFTEFVKIYLLVQKKCRNLNSRENVVGRFRAQVLSLLIQQCPGYEIGTTSFPSETLQNMMSALNEYPFRWNSLALWKEAREMWDVRPSAKEENRREEERRIAVENVEWESKRKARWKIFNRNRDARRVTSQSRERSVA